MFSLTLIVTLLTAYFAKQSYDNYRFEWAMFWSVLVGWDFHTLITYL